MIRFVMLLLMISALAGCGKHAASPESRESVVLNVLADADGSGVVISIRVRPEASQDTIKRIAEDIIEENRSRFKNVTVRSYLPGADPSGAPYGLSTFSEGVITHRFDPRAATRKVPTH